MIFCQKQVQIVVLAFLAFNFLFLPAKLRAQMLPPLPPPAPPINDSDQELKYPVLAQAWYNKKPQIVENVCNLDGILKEDGNLAHLVRKKNTPRDRFVGKLVTACILADFGKAYRSTGVLVLAKKEGKECEDGVAKVFKNVYLRIFYYSEDDKKWKYGGLRNIKSHHLDKYLFQKRFKKAPKVRYLLVCRWGGSHKKPNIGIESVALKVPSFIVQDLSLAKVKISPARYRFGVPFGKKIKFKVKVRFFGNAPHSPKELKNVKISILDQKGFGVTKTIRVIPRGTKIVTLPIKFNVTGLLDYNPHYFKIKIDPDNKIVEDREDNNEETLVVPVLPWDEQEEIKEGVFALGPKNYRAKGKLKANHYVVRVKERVKIKVTGEDNDGVFELRLWRPFKLFQPGSWFAKVQRKYCKHKKSCKKVWKKRFKKAGTYEFCGAVIGHVGKTRKLEGVRTSPPCIKIKVIK